MARLVCTDQNSQKKIQTRASHRLNAPLYKPYNIPRVAVALTIHSARASQLSLKNQGPPSNGRTEALQRRLLLTIGAAVLFLLAFAMLTAMYIYQLLKTRTWFCIPFTPGSIYTPYSKLILLQSCRTNNMPYSLTL